MQKINVFYEIRVNQCYIINNLITHITITINYFILLNDYFIKLIK
jgi:hypothetical protein